MPGTDAALIVFVIVALAVSIAAVVLAANNTTALRGSGAAAPSCTTYYHGEPAAGKPGYCRTFPNKISQQGPAYSTWAKAVAAYNPMYDVGIYQPKDSTGWARASETTTNGPWNTLYTPPAAPNGPCKFYSAMNNKSGWCQSRPHTITQLGTATYASWDEATDAYVSAVSGEVTGPKPVGVYQNSNNRWALAKGSSPYGTNTNTLYTPFDQVQKDYIEVYG